MKADCATRQFHNYMRGIGLRQKKFLTIHLASFSSRNRSFRVSNKPVYAIMLELLTGYPRHLSVSVTAVYLPFDTHVFNLA